MLYRFNVVGHCIYCGDKVGPLSREHVMPQGLGGRNTLDAASCGSCAKITSAVEQSCLREMIGPIRYRLNLSTRKKKERPTNARLELLGFDDRVKTHRIPLNNHPHAFILPLFNEPGILRGCGIDEKPSFYGTWYYQPSLSPNQTAPGLGAKMFGVQCNHLLFSRMIAKIAHCFVVGTAGADNFEPLLVDLILGRTEAFPYLVGGQLREMRPTPGKIHVMLLRRVNDLLVLNMRLFSNFGAPAYRVVVGKCKNGLEEHILDEQAHRSSSLAQK